MKNVNPQRFQKPEDISFKPMPLPNNPPARVEKPAINADKPPIVRTNERTPQTLNKENNSTSYLIEIPATRIKTRHSYDIFIDQKNALNKIQMAMADTGKGKPSLGDMIQEAIDSYIKEKAKKAGNIKIIRESSGERMNERSNERTENNN
jgi:hypothetical protein